MPSLDCPRKYSSDDLSTSSPNFHRGPVFQDLDGQFTPEQLSSLESDDNFVPPPLPPPILAYERIPIPREPTLEDILREATEGRVLAQVTNLRLRVITAELSLQRVAIYCPLLTSLNLQGSAVSTLRDLGCLMTNLKYLDVSQCGLRSLDGTSGLASVTHLVADSNRIEYLDPCAFLDNLQELAVRDNLIRTTYNFLCLSHCPLRVLHMEQNPIEEAVDNLKAVAKQMLTGLIFFNGERIREEPDGIPCQDESLSTRETSSSSSSGSFSSLEKSLEPLDAINSAVVDTGAQVTRSSGTSSSVSSAAEQPDSFPELLQLRNRQFIGSNPRDNTHVLSFIHSFPARLPQTQVELELGVIGTVLDKPRRVLSAVSDTATLLRMAQNWRKLRKSATKRAGSATGRLPGYDIITNDMTV